MVGIDVDVVVPNVLKMKNVLNDSGINNWSKAVRFNQRLLDNKSDEVFPLLLSPKPCQLENKLARPKVLNMVGLINSRGINIKEVSELSVCKSIWFCCGPLLLIESIAEKLEIDTL